MSGIEGETLRKINEGDNHTLKKIDQIDKSGPD